MPAEEMAKVLLEAVVTYISEHPKTSLDRIDVVILTPELVCEYVSSMLASVEKKDSLWDWFKGSISGLVEAFVGDPQEGSSGAYMHTGM